ncbi:MAG: hypothetical protein Q4G19_04435 [Clostridia bacterium]|nr:hypothetical protein [Clostridia bacterium]
MKDLRYRGPLSSRGIRFIALLAMTVSQIASLILAIRGIASHAGPEIAESILSSELTGFYTFLQSLGGITFPLLLIASMSIVIRKREKIFRVMLGHFLLAVLTYLFIVLIAEKMALYLIEEIPNILPAIQNLDETVEVILSALIDQYTGGDLPGVLERIGLSPEILAAVLGSAGGETAGTEVLASLLSVPESAADLAKLLVSGLPKILDTFGLTTEQGMEMLADMIIQEFVRSHLNVNVFLDLFLCTVFWFFITYQPKKLLGGKLLLFRCCAVFPMLYLILGVVLMGMNRVNWVQMSLPLWLVGLLPSRKLPGILLFLAMALYVKYHEAEELQKGGNTDTFSSFLNTNRNSLRFALFLCVVLALLSAADWCAGRIGSGQLAPWGIGVSTTMYLSIPFILLFSYSRKPRFMVLNAFVPVYYFLHYLILFLVVLLMIYAAPQILNGVPFEALDFSGFGT